MLKSTEVLDQMNSCCKKRWKELWMRVNIEPREEADLGILNKCVHDQLLAPFIECWCNPFQLLSHCWISTLSAKVKWNTSWEFMSFCQEIVILLLKLVSLCFISNKLPFSSFLHTHPGSSFANSFQWSQGSKFTVATVANATMFCHLLPECSSGSKHLLLP